jgi:hypothetical protein
MSMTLALVAVPGVTFEAVEADPQLLRWLRERALLDWSTTLRGYILEPDECEPDDLRRMAQVDGFGLRAEDFVLVDYLAVSRIVDDAAAATRPPVSEASRERMQAWLAGGARGVLVLDEVPAAFDGDGDPPDPFAPDGELEYDAGYGNCTFWSPAGFAASVAKAPGWRALREHDPGAGLFLDRAIAERRHVVGIVY